MRANYTSLGAVPGLAKRETERRDALLARTGSAARQLLKLIKKRYAPKDQVRELNSVLASFDAGLPGRVHRVAEKLHREGMSVDMAVERALALALADASIDKIKNLGIAYERGMVGPGLGLPVWSRRVVTPTDVRQVVTPTDVRQVVTPTDVRRFGLRGLGETGTTTSPEQVVGSMFQGILCSQGLQAAVTDMVGRSEGRDAASATNVGFTVGSGMAQCQQLQTPAAPPPPPPAESDEGPSLLVPVLVGLGTLGAVGAFLYLKRKSG